VNYLLQLKEEEIKRLQNENIQLMQCIVDCINRPKGVIPDSVVNLNKGHFWNEHNA
jgi:hypothetical protein